MRVVNRTGVHDAHSIVNSVIFGAAAYESFVFFQIAGKMEHSGINAVAGSQIVGQDLVRGDDARSAPDESPLDEAREHAFLGRDELVRVVVEVVSKKRHLRALACEPCGRQIFKIAGTGDDRVALLTLYDLRDTARACANAKREVDRLTHEAESATMAASRKDLVWNLVMTTGKTSRKGVAGDRLPRRNHTILGGIKIP